MDIKLNFSDQELERLKDDMLKTKNYSVSDYFSSIFKKRVKLS